MDLAEIYACNQLSCSYALAVGDLHAAVQKAVADRKQKDTRHKEGVYASSTAPSSKDRSGNGRNDHDRISDRHRHNSHMSSDSHGQDRHRNHSDKHRDSSRGSSRDNSQERGRPRSESRHRSSWDGSGTPLVKRDEDEWEMTPSRSGRATPTPSRGATGRSQWDYMASPAPSPVRAGTGKSMKPSYVHSKHLSNYFWRHMQYLHVWHAICLRMSLGCHLLQPESNAGIGHSCHKLLQHFAISSLAC